MGRGWCGRGGGCQRGVGTDFAPKAAERKEEAAKISRWVDREEMIVRLITNGPGKGDKNRKVPRKRELVLLGSRRRSRHGRGSCAPGEWVCRQGVDRMLQQHGKCQPGVGAAPSPHPALGRGTTGGRRRQRHSEHPRRVGGNPWSEMKGGGEQHRALCGLSADSCHLHSRHGHAGSWRGTEPKTKCPAR